MLADSPVLDRVLRRVDSQLCRLTPGAAALMYRSTPEAVDHVLALAEERGEFIIDEALLFEACACVFGICACRGEVAPGVV